MFLLRAIGEYFLAVWADWISRMSGVASIVISFLAAYSELKDKGKPALWIAAAICYLITSFSVWYKNRPDLKIEIRDIAVQLNAFTLMNRDPMTSLVVLELYLVNTRPANNAIKQYALCIKTDKHTLSCQDASVYGLRWRQTQAILKDLRSIQYDILMQGKPVVGHLGFIIDDDELGKFSGKKLILTVTDSYNVLRKVTATIPAGSIDRLERVPIALMLHAYKTPRY
ncbi:MAG: hypothetical protein QOE33_1363 [Acidobacteriota bacterium]|nr:hypothetical protein [Acidobacteriota bacterium]